MRQSGFRRGSVLIKDIWISPSRRPVNPDDVARLAESIREIGLLTPITVRVAETVIDPEEGEIADVTALVAGRHRLEAVRSLGVDRIECFFSDFDEIHAELAEIDENLIRGNLSPAQEAAAISRRKEIYETLHPETKQHVAGAHGSNRVQGRDASDNLSFASATAEATGKDKRTVERAAARGKVLGDDLNALAGTSLDKGTELDALSKLTPTERAALIERAKAGEKVSARKPSIDSDVKQRAARAVAEYIIERADGNDLDAVKANLFAADAKNIAVELTNILGESIMDRRYA